MAAAVRPRVPAALLEDLELVRAAAQATLNDAARCLAHLSSKKLPALFVCPIDSRHRLSAAVLAAHTATCHAARHGLHLPDLPCSPGGSLFWYADAPAVVRVKALPIDQQPEAGLKALQQQPGCAASVAAGSFLQDAKFPAAMPALVAALREWEDTGTARSSMRCLAEVEVAAWGSLPPTMPGQVGRLLAAVPPATLGPLVQAATAGAGVGVTESEAQALGTLAIWHTQGASAEGADQKEQRLRRIMAALTPYLVPPAPAASFLLALWQSLLCNLLRSLPRCGPPSPLVSVAQAGAALEQLREGTRWRQRRENAAHPPLSCGERLARYDAAVETAAAVRAQRPMYRPLPDTDWLFRPHTPGQQQAGPGRRRMELLAELRDRKRRTTSYRAKQQKTPLQSARELIELRMLQLEEVWGPGKQTTGNMGKGISHSEAAPPRQDSRGWQAPGKGQLEGRQGSWADPSRGTWGRKPWAREEGANLHKEQDSPWGSDDEETRKRRKLRQGERGDSSSGRRAEHGRKRSEEREGSEERKRGARKERRVQGGGDTRDAGSGEIHCLGSRRDGVRGGSEQWGAAAGREEGEMGRWGDEVAPGAHAESTRLGGQKRAHRDHRSTDERGPLGSRRYRTHV